MQKILLCRHGETEWSKNGRHTGLTDLELTQNGEQEAAKLNTLLAEYRGYKAYASPLKRAHKTAQIAGFDPEIRDELLEWNYGDYEGLTSEEIHDRAPEWNVFSHGGPHGESPEDVEMRADKFIVMLRSNGENAILFSSGHFSRALAARWIEAPIEVGKHLILSTASVSILSYEHDYPAIVCWNNKKFG